MYDKIHYKKTGGGRGEETGKGKEVDSSLNALKEGYPDNILIITKWNLFLDSGFKNSKKFNLLLQLLSLWYLIKTAIEN